MHFRHLRLNNLIQEELSKIIQKELEFPGALVTITGVETDEKLEETKIKISVLPPLETENALKLLNQERARLQHILLRKLNIKPMPHIRFTPDAVSGSLPMELD